MNNLLAYSDAIHPLYFLTRFIEGLRNDIRDVVMVQRPPDLDAVCALALLQEEVADSLRTTPYRHKSRPLPLPPPPPNRVVLQHVTNNLADRKSAENTRRGEDNFSKLQTLKNYRRATGLCFKCGENWRREHTCPATIQLHIVEELMEFMGADGLGINDEQDTGTVCLISLKALSEKFHETEGVPIVLQIQGMVHGQPVLMLVDSGSIASFINSKLRPLM